MEIHRDLVVGRAVELRKELDKTLVNQDKFIEYKDAKTGYVYAWHDLKRKQYIVFMAQETDDHTKIEGFTIHDNRNSKHIPHTVSFDKRKANGMFIDLTGANPDATYDNIQDFVNTFVKETEFECIK